MTQRESPMPHSEERIADLFRLHHPALKSYLYRMTASVEDAEDLASETFLLVMNRIDSFEGRSSIRTWIFTIATNLARDRIRTQRRWSVNAQDQAKQAASADELLEDFRNHQQTNPDVRFEMSEHIDLCFTCMMKTLPLEGQIVLMLGNIYDFTTKEIAVIVNKSEASVKHILRQTRNTTREIFENRCSLVSRTGVCHQCTELNGIFNPKQKHQEELMKLRMVQESRKNSTDQLRLLDIRLELIRSIDPFGGTSAALHLSHMKMLRSAIHDD